LCISLLLIAMLALSSYFFYDYRYFYFQPTKGGGSIILSNNNRDLVIDPGDRVKTDAQFTLAAIGDVPFSTVLKRKFIILI
jgi:hypothetical protein